MEEASCRVRVEDLWVTPSGGKWHAVYWRPQELISQSKSLARQVTFDEDSGISGRKAGRKV
jgi:hypothetical protein